MAKNQANRQPFFRVPFRDAVTWVLIDTVTDTLTNPVYAGLAVTSCNTSAMHGHILQPYRDFPESITDSSVTLGTNPAVPVTYTIFENGWGNFSMITEGYKSISSSHRYDIKLDQNLQRAIAGAGCYYNGSRQHLFAGTLYDFRSNLSNPEFNMTGGGFICVQALHNMRRGQ